MIALITLIVCIVLGLATIGLITSIYALINGNILLPILDFFSRMSVFITQTPNKEDIQTILSRLRHSSKNLEYLLMECNLSLNKIKTVLNYLEKEGIIKKYYSNDNDEIVYSLKSVYLKQLKSQFTDINNS